MTYPYGVTTHDSRLVAFHNLPQMTACAQRSTFNPRTIGNVEGRVGPCGRRMLSRLPQSTNGQITRYSGFATWNILMHD